MHKSLILNLFHFSLQHILIHKSLILNHFHLQHILSENEIAERRVDIAREESGYCLFQQCITYDGEKATEHIVAEIVTNAISPFRRCFWV